MATPIGIDQRRGVPVASPPAAKRMLGRVARLPSATGALERAKI